MMGGVTFVLNAHACTCVGEFSLLSMDSDNWDMGIPFCTCVGEFSFLSMDSDNWDMGIPFSCKGEKG